MHTNAEAKKTVYFVAKMICEEVPQLQPRFTEVKEAAAMFLAASEAAAEFKALKAGGAALILKAPGKAPADEFFYLNKFTNSVPSDGLAEVMGNAAASARREASEPAKPARVHLTPAPSPAAAPDAPVTERLKTSKFNYDAHLMMMLSTVPNSVKLRRIQDIISVSQTGDPYDGGYLSNTCAAVEVQAKVRIGMMFLNWQRFGGAGIGQPFYGGYTYVVKWFQKY
jgi:hypothetical protein